MANPLGRIYPLIENSPNSTQKLNDPQPITFGRHTVADTVPGVQLKIENPISFMQIDCVNYIYKNDNNNNYTENCPKRKKKKQNCVTIAFTFVHFGGEQPVLSSLIETYRCFGICIEKPKLHFTLLLPIYERFVHTSIHFCEH
jgi:hypothetical protein